MRVIVCKFGGSSVATPDHLRSVAQRVVSLRESGRLPVVVVAANRLGVLTSNGVSLTIGTIQ